MKVKKIMNAKTLLSCKLTAIGAVVGLLTLIRAQSTLGQSYSGQATVINLSHIHSQPIPGPIVICDTGPLPSIGGNLTVSFGGTNAFGGALVFQNASASTAGAGGQANSQASVQNFTLELLDANGGVDTLTPPFIGPNANPPLPPSGPTIGGRPLISGLGLNVPSPLGTPPAH